MATGPQCKQDICSKALIPFRAADSDKPIRGAARGSPTLEQSRNAWGVLAAQAPYTASPYLSPPLWITVHLAARLLGQGLHLLLELLAALEELPQQHPGVRAAEVAPCVLVSPALHRRPRLVHLLAGEEESALSRAGCRPQAQVPWRLHGPIQPGDVAGTPPGLPPSQRGLGALPPGLTSACSCCAVSITNLFTYLAANCSSSAWVGSCCFPSSLRSALTFCPLGLASEMGAGAGLAFVGVSLGPQTGMLPDPRIPRSPAG